MKTVSHEYFVSLEVAKLLKKAGFNWDTYSAYNKDGVFADKNRSITTWNDFADYYSAPTLEVAQRWLREVKHIEICISWEIEFEEKELDWNERQYCYDIDTHVDNIPLLSIDDDYWAEGYHTFGDSYSTYEEALEAGIKKALEIILEKGK